MPLPQEKKLIYSVPVIGRYLQYYQVFRKYAGDRALWLGLISVFSTLTEGLGIAIFIA